MELFWFLVVEERVESCFNKEAQIDRRHWSFKGLIWLCGLWYLS